MEILAMVAGLDEFEMSVVIEPHETVMTLFTMYEQKLRSSKMPHQFTAGYSIEHTRRGGFGDDEDPDFIAMQAGEPDVVTKYLTPAARLDPRETVSHHFGTSVTPDTISIVLTWLTGTIAYAKRERERARNADDELLATEREEPNSPPAHLPAPQTSSPEAKPSRPTTMDSIHQTMTVASPWQWLSSCVPLAVGCSLNVGRHDETKMDN